MKYELSPDELATALGLPRSFDVAPRRYDGCPMRTRCYFEQLFDGAPEAGRIAALIAYAVFMALVFS